MRNKTIISNNYNKCDYFDVSTIFNSLVFYTLEKHKVIYHLTFDKERHKKAILILQKTSVTIKKLPIRHIASEKILELLSQKSNIQEIQHSPFFQQGSVFQQEVWKQINEIRFGQRQTYGELAQKLGNRNLARAVGQACNANPLALLIPCHRVVGKTDIGGFAGGNDIKRQLLLLENSIRD